MEKNRVEKQLNFEELFGDSVSVVAEPHLACVLLLDVSGSMVGDSVSNLNKAISRFKEHVSKDEMTRKCVEIAIVTFSSQVNVVSDFVPIEKFPDINLQADGSAMMAEGINQAIDMVKRRNVFYQQIGIPFFDPIIIMLTDGVSDSSPDEMECVAKRIQEEETDESKGKLKLWVVGISDCDYYEMFKLTKRVIKLRDCDDYDFTGIFDFHFSEIQKMTFGTDIPVTEEPPIPNRCIDESWY